VVARYECLLERLIPEGESAGAGVTAVVGLAISLVVPGYARGRCIGCKGVMVRVELLLNVPRRQGG
jgi:hypothetical protein